MTQKQNVAQKLITSHLISGTLKPGTEISLRVDQTLTQDATGTMVILGGQRIPMEEIVSIGDRVTYGDYNSEVFVMDEKKVRELCDRVQMNYTEDPEGVRIVRVQDIRGFEREIPNIPEYKCANMCGAVEAQNG